MRCWRRRGWRLRFKSGKLPLTLALSPQAGRGDVRRMGDLIAATPMAWRGTGRGRRRPFAPLAGRRSRQRDEGLNRRK
ncbi:hypothetical protein CN229_10240 [Sinorhizobium meliloti]|nr:hypothetical protein CN229_10240 [Sinorhizobium meliloti]RVG32806.1 hypothetical protein CN225_18705 [Sinorhizobium meliloti]RVG51398.1 hypothetical protein CN224_27605 [Sinorhizobium meliloti]